MTSDGVLRRVHEGSAPERLAWSLVESLFDACFGRGAHELRRGTVRAGWTDDEGRGFDADRLGDVAAAYRERATHVLHFNGSGTDVIRCDFEYRPGSPRPRARLAIEGADAVVGTAIETAKAAFPLPYDGAVIFLSWGGERSREVAATFAEVLRPRFPAAEVFISSTSIDPGDDPMRRILDEGLLRSQALVATLTDEAARRPWVIWETAAAWARGKLVIPVFVDLDPSDVPGPLTQRVQGVHLHHRSDLDRALQVLARELAFPEPANLSDDEHQSLISTSQRPRR